MLLTPSLCHKLSHLVGPPPPSNVTYFMDCPKRATQENKYIFKHRSKTSFLMLPCMNTGAIIEYEFVLTGSTTIRLRTFRLRHFDRLQTIRLRTFRLRHFDRLQTFRLQTFRLLL